MRTLEIESENIYVEDLLYASKFGEDVYAFENYEIVSPDLFRNSNYSHRYWLGLKHISDPYTINIIKYWKYDSDPQYCGIKVDGHITFIENTSRYFHDYDI